MRQVVEPFVDQCALQTRIDFPVNLKSATRSEPEPPVRYFVKGDQIEDRTTFKVIHQAKGETHDAVEVVAGRATGTQRDDLTQRLNLDGGLRKDKGCVKSRWQGPGRSLFLRYRLEPPKSTLTGYLLISKSQTVEASSDRRLSSAPCQAGVG